MSVSRVELQRTLTSFSESPRHLLTMLEAEMLKKVVLHSVATALASRVLPVPVCMWRRRESGGIPKCEERSSQVVTD